MANTLTPVNPRWVGNKNGKQGMVPSAVVADGAATWKAGELLRQDADGLVYEVTTGQTSAQYMAITDLAAATGDETGAVLQTVAVLDDGDMFEIFELDTTIGRASKGLQCGINVSSNLLTIDVSDVTNKILEVVRVTSLDDRPYGPEASDDIKAKCIVKVMGTAIYAART